MKVMAKIISLADLSIYFVSDFSLSEEAAKKLTAELKERLFFPVANYLGYNAYYSSIVPKTALAPVHLAGVEKIIKESGVVFAGVELNTRLKNILTTYLKGIRSRVDTRLTLSKDVMSGGLGLDYKVIDKIFKVADEINAGQTLLSGNLTALPLVEPIKTGLDKVRALYEQPGEARDIPYDLKSAIASGVIKKPVTPFNLPIPEEAKEKLLTEAKKEVTPVVVTPPVIKIPETIKAEVKPIPVLVPVIPSVPLAAAVSIKPLIDDVLMPIAKTINKPVNLTQNNQINRPLEPKIAQPPLRKPGLFSKLFNKETPKVVTPEVKKIITPNKLEATQTSIASLRTQAATPNNPIIKSPVISDIQSAPKVMGPLEELRYLDLVNFRRFGSSPSDATAKVESKIRLLEKDGYDKMVLGVLAWRDSLVNSLYLKMVQESLTKGISLKQCANDYQLSKNNNFLFWEEIEAIMALNSRLMF